MSQTHKERMDELAQEMIIEYAHIPDVVYNYSLNFPSTENGIIVMVFLSYGGFPAQKAAGLTARVEVPSCPCCHRKF